MKILVTAALVLTLTGCAVVDKVTALWPRDHDPAMVSAYIQLERAMEATTCNDRVMLADTASVADWLFRYSDFRNDPQTTAAKNVKNNLEKAVGASDAVCERYLNLTKINMKLIKDSWSKR